MAIVKSIIMHYTSPSTPPHLEEWDLLIKFIDDHKNTFYAPGYFKDDNYYLRFQKNKPQQLPFSYVVAWAYFPKFDTEH